MKTPSFCVLPHPSRILPPSRRCSATVHDTKTLPALSTCGPCRNIAFFRRRNTTLPALSSYAEWQTLNCPTYFSKAAFQVRRPFAQYMTGIIFNPSGQYHRTARTHREEAVVWCRTAFLARSVNIADADLFSIFLYMMIVLHTLIHTRIEKWTDFTSKLNGSDCDLASSIS